MVRYLNNNNIKSEQGNDNLSHTSSFLISQMLHQKKKKINPTNKCRKSKAMFGIIEIV